MEPKAECVDVREQKLRACETRYIHPTSIDHQNRRGDVGAVRDDRRRNSVPDDEYMTSTMSRAVLIASQSITANAGAQTNKKAPSSAEAFCKYPFLRSGVPVPELTGFLSWDIAFI